MCKWNLNCPVFLREAKMPHFCSGLISSSLLLGKNRRPLEGMWSPLFRPLIVHFYHQLLKPNNLAPLKGGTSVCCLMQCSFCLSVLRTLLPMPPPPGLRRPSPLTLWVHLFLPLWCVPLDFSVCLSMLSCNKAGPVFIPTHSIVPGIQRCQH